MRFDVSLSAALEGKVCALLVSLSMAGISDSRRAPWRAFMISGWNSVASFAIFEVYFAM